MILVDPPTRSDHDNRTDRASHEREWDVTAPTMALTVLSGTTAIVADEWALVRLGMVHALRSAGVRVLADEQKGEDAVRRALAEEATFLLVGLVRDTPIADLVRRARGSGRAAPHVVVLLDSATRDELGDVVSLGADALLARSLHPEELVDALERITQGERVVAPAFLPLLVGMLGPASDDSEGGANVDAVLTRKEIEVLAKLAQGLANRDIAEALFITPATVKTHLAHIYVKLTVTNRREAIAKAVALGLLG